MHLFERPAKPRDERREEGQYVWGCEPPRGIEQLVLDRCAPVSLEAMSNSPRINSLHCVRIRLSLWDSFQSNEGHYVDGHSSSKEDQEHRAPLLMQNQLDARVWVLVLLLASILVSGSTEPRQSTSCYHEVELVLPFGNSGSRTTTSREFHKSNQDHTTLWNPWYQYQQRCGNIQLPWRYSSFLNTRGPSASKLKEMKDQA